MEPGRRLERSEQTERLRPSRSAKRVQTSPNFLCMLSVAAAQSSYGVGAICYVLPVLWMTSCFPILGPRRGNASRV